MKKQILSLLLCTAMLAPSASASAFQITDNEITDPCSIWESTAETQLENSAASSPTTVRFNAKSGDTATLYIKIKNSSSVSGLLGEVFCEESFLEFKGIRELYSYTYANIVYPGGYTMFSVLLNSEGTNMLNETRVIAFDFNVRKDIISTNNVLRYTISEFYDSNLMMLNQNNIGYDIEIKPAENTHTHTEVIDPAIEATCTKTGLTAGSHCSVCGEIIKKQEVIPKKNHTPVTVKGHEATCSKTGLTDGSKCSVCGTVIEKQNTIPKKPHTPVVIPAVPPTATSNGLTEGSKCSVCGEILQEQQIIGPIGHTHQLVIDPAVEATCTQKGLTEGEHCSECGEITKQQIEIPMIPHKFENGKCKMCGTIDTSKIRGVYGDIDDDGSITSSDALEVLRESVGLVKFDDTKRILADVDRDGEVTSSDSLEILRYYVGLPAGGIVGENYIP